MTPKEGAITLRVRIDDHDEYFGKRSAFSRAFDFLKKPGARRKSMEDVEGRPIRSEFFRGGPKTAAAKLEETNKNKYVGDERYHALAFERGKMKMRLEILEEEARDEAARELREDASFYAGYSTADDSGEKDCTSGERA